MVVRPKHFPLEHRELDLDLVEPTGMHCRVHDHDAEAKGLQFFGRRLPRCEEPLSTILNTRRPERTMPASSHRGPADRKAVLPVRDSKRPTIMVRWPGVVRVAR